VGDEIVKRRIRSITVGAKGKLTIETPPESWASSIVKGWAREVIEAASETAGEGITAGGKWVARKGLDKLPFGRRLFDSLRQRYLLHYAEAGAAATFVDRFFNAADFGSLVGEFSEEELANILHGIAATERFTDDPNAGYLDNLIAAIGQDLDVRNAAVTVTSLAVPVAVRAGAKAVKHVVQSKRASARIVDYARSQMEALASVEKPTAEEIAEKEFLTANAGDAKTLAEHFMEQTLIEKGEAYDRETAGRIPRGQRVGQEPGRAVQEPQRGGETTAAGGVVQALRRGGEVAAEGTQGTAGTTGTQGTLPWIEGRERPFAFDQNSTQNEGRFRLYPPDLLTDYFRRKSSTPGISYVIGKPAAGGKGIIQAIRFNKNQFSEEEAAQWWTHNKGKYEFYQGKTTEGQAQPKAEVEKRTEGTEGTQRTAGTQGIAEGASIWERALADADAEAAQQARERYVGPEQWTFEDFAGALSDRSEEDLRSLARQLGAKVPGASGENLRKWIGDAVSTLTKEGPEPPPPLAGERHPGSMTYKKFFERYGQALEKARTDPAQQAWLDRYGKAQAGGTRGLYKDLVHEWNRIKAWEAFFELTGQERPERIEEGTEGTAGTQGTIEGARTEEEAREINVEEESREAQDAMSGFLGQGPPADIAPPATPDGTPGPEPSARQYGLIADLMHRWGLRHREGYEPFSNKDFREIYKFIQLPDDIRKTFPQFEPVYQVQRARERAKQVLDRVLAEKAGPYFALADAERKAVDQVLVAMDQTGGDNVVVGPMIAALSPRQYAGCQAARQSLDSCAELLITRMRELGVEEERIGEFMGRIGNYIPHKWYGDWAVVVRERKPDGTTGRVEFMSGVGKTNRFTEMDRLAKLYPQSDVQVIERTKLPYEMFQDAPVWAVNRMIEQIEEEAKTRARREGREYDPRMVDMIRQVREDLYKAKGFGMHFVKRTETPGWTEDLRKPIAEYLTGFSGFLTKMQAGMQFPAALEAIDPRRTPQLYKYASDYVRYVMGDEAHWQRVKPILYTYYLYGNFKTGTVNLTQNLILGWPVLSKYTNLSLARLMVAGMKVARRQLNAGETAFLEQLESEGYLDAKMSQEISGRGGNAVYRLLGTPIEKGLSLLDYNRLVERFNRQSMAVALYDAGITELARAAKIIKEAHFDYGKGNRPTLFRGQTSILTVFRSFNIHQLTWIKNEMKTEWQDVKDLKLRKALIDAGPLVRHIAAWTLVGGLKALPLVELGIAIYAKIFGRDPEEDANELMGKMASEILFRGLPSQAGVSLTGSVGMKDILPTVEQDQALEVAVGEWMLGVAGDLPMRGKRVSDDLARKQWGRAIEDLMPEALRNPMAAWRLYHEGATARNGRIIWDFDRQEPVKLNRIEAILKGMGFQTDRISQAWERKRLLELVGGQRESAKSLWADRLYLASKTHDLDEAANVDAEMKAWNERWQRRNRTDLMINPNDVYRLALNRRLPINRGTSDERRTYYKMWPKE